jgi:hypothetical protein
MKPMPYSHRTQKCSEPNHLDSTKRPQVSVQNFGIAKDHISPGNSKLRDTFSAQTKHDTTTSTGARNPGLVSRRVSSTPQVPNLQGIEKNLFAPRSSRPCETTSARPEHAKTTSAAARKPPILSRAVCRRPLPSFPTIPPIPPWVVDAVWEHLDYLEKNGLTLPDPTGRDSDFFPDPNGVDDEKYWLNSGETDEDGRL